MKKNLFFAAIAVAAIAVSCNKSEQPAEKGVTVSFTGEMAETTKLYLDPTSYQVKFNKNDPFMIWGVQGTTTQGKTCYVSTGDGVEPMKFSAQSYNNLSASAETYFIAATAMKSGYPSIKDLSTKKVNFKIFKNQKITAKGPVGMDSDNINKCLIPLYAVSDTYSSLENMPNVTFKFKHVAAYGKLIVKNLAIESGYSVSKVNLKSGSQYFSQQISIDQNGNIAWMTNYDKELDLYVTDMKISSGNFDVIFVTAPVNIGNTSPTITVTVTDGTTTKTFSKKVSVPTGKGNFQTGHILPFNVDFTGVEAK